ncbi:MAG: hypothetical protein IPH06_13005 [Alphaproteobacteria bacterium]|nr:hypothetical protein [Alphaproteobacteria bacterium]QQS56380.1 MAG: hypothetical protein IPN28_08760 [Alphaproteobacteria bacterium]
MCVVVQRHLGKGGPLRASRCIPPGLWRSSGIEPNRAIETCSRFIAGQGAGPDTRQSERSCPDTQTLSGRPRTGAFAPPFLGTFPSTNRPPVGCRQRLSRP